MKGGIYIGWNLSFLGFYQDPEEFYMMFLSQEIDIKFIRNLYVKFCMKIVDLKRSYSANTQAIWNNDFPGEPKKVKFAPIIVWI